MYIKLARNQALRWFGANHILSDPVMFSMYLVEYVSFISPVVQCPQLNATSPLIIDINTTTYLSMVNYACEFGYNLIGNSIRTCQENRSWTGIEPECESKYTLHLYTYVKCSVSVWQRSTKV